MSQISGTQPLDMDMDDPPAAAPGPTSSSLSPVPGPASYGPRRTTASAIGNQSGFTPKTPDKRRIDSTKRSRERRDRSTEDATLIPYPRNRDEYNKTINDLIEQYFTDVDCFKMIRMLDILHSTLRTALLQKKNIKTNSYVSSVLENRSLYNYLNDIVSKDTMPLYQALFDQDGNGIIIWGSTKTVGKGNKEKNTQFLAQLVNPNIAFQSREGWKNVHTKSGKRRKPHASKILTQNANNWFAMPSASMSSSSSSSSSSAAASASASGNVTVQQYLDDPENYPPLIFDKITEKKANQELKFSMVAGEEQITLSVAMQDENYPLIALDRSGRPTTTLDSIGNYDNVLESIRYLPFFQAYNRDLKVGDYKPNGDIDNQRAWHNDYPEGGITPIYNGEMFCALCGRQLVEKRGEVSYDVDHVWNLILNSVLNVLDDPEGYFDTHDSCNRTFKSDKVFLPNIGIWNKMFQKASQYDSTETSKYRWPGETYGLAGLSKTIPEGGFKTFTIGYIEDRFRVFDYKNNGIDINAKNSGVVKLNEALNHKDIDNKWGGPRFNEFDLQLKFLKRTLKLANDLHVVSERESVVKQKLIQPFLNEIILLQVGAENMNTLKSLNSFFESNNIDYSKLPIPMQTVIDILAIPDKDGRERNFKAVLDHYIKANTRGVFVQGYEFEQAGPSTRVENSDYYNELVALLREPKIGDDESIIKAKNLRKKLKKYKKNLKKNTSMSQKLTIQHVTNLRNTLRSLKYIEARNKKESEHLYILGVALQHLEDIILEKQKIRDRYNPHRVSSSSSASASLSPPKPPKNQSRRRISPVSSPSSSSGAPPPPPPGQRGRSKKKTPRSPWKGRASKMFKDYFIRNTDRSRSRSRDPPARGSPSSSGAAASGAAASSPFRAVAVSPQRPVNTWGQNRRVRGRGRGRGRGRQGGTRRYKKKKKKTKRRNKKLRKKTKRKRKKNKKRTRKNN